MNFLEQQAKARRTTWALLLLVPVTVLVVVILMNIAALIASGFVLAFNEGMRPANLEEEWLLFDRILIWTTVLTPVTVFGGALYKLFALSGAGGKVAVAAGGERLPELLDERQRRLRNVVEEIAIASGVPVPEIYVLRDEAGINAFVAGTTPANAALAVTQGALELLTRDELQGVVAHECSHILNGDMRLNIRLMGLTFGLLMVYVSGRELARLPFGLGPSPQLRRHAPGGLAGLFRRQGATDGGFNLAGWFAGIIVCVVSGLLLMAVGYLGVLCARLIKAGVSRQREFLADASAVQFTRLPQGLAGALKKIGGVELSGRTRKRRKGGKTKTPYASRLSQARQEEVSHMLFGNGFALSGWFATHPPVLDRVQRLEPGFKAEHWSRLIQRWATPEHRTLLETPEAAASVAMTALAPATTVPVDQHWAERIGAMSAPHLRSAAVLHQSIPADLRAAAHSTEDALPLLLALQLGTSPDVVATQLKLIEADWGATRCARSAQLSQAVSGLAGELRLPLVALAFPKVRSRGAIDLEALAKTCLALVRVDRRVTPFEYALGKLLAVQIDEVLHPRRARAHGQRTLASLRAPAADLLSVLAILGHHAREQAAQAYALGATQLFGSDAPPLATPANVMQAMDAALDVLNGLRAPDKAPLMDAIARVLAHDGHVSTSEHELLRAVCAVLHCPLPPSGG